MRGLINRGLSLCALALASLLVFCWRRRRACG